MSYSGFLLKIGDYTIPHKYIKADSYSAYVNMQDIDPWTDSKGYVHRDKTVELKALKVEFETRAMLTNKEFDEGLLVNIIRQFVKPVGKECYITAYIPELAGYVTQYGYMADFTPKIYRTEGDTIWYDPTRIAFVGGVYNGLSQA